MSRYAEGTTVPAEKSRAELERLLERYGAANFYYGAEPTKTIIGFKARERFVRFTMPVPPLADFKKIKSREPYWKERTAEQQREAQQAEIRRRWRCLVLAVKSKLESVQTGIETFEEAFLAHIVTYDGSTVGQKILPQIEKSYGTGRDVPLLLGGSDP